MTGHGPTEYLLGGVAACGAGFFTNPLEVVKTRMQLQGELQARGQYTVHYRNAFHGFYIIVRTDGLLAVQSGLVPALWYQFFMNGCRFGTYQLCVNYGLTKRADGHVSFPRSVLAGAFAGVVGSFFGSPFYMVKTHLQARSANNIAVGFQHEHSSMSQALSSVYRKHGVLALWRGVSAALARVMVGSAAQLSTFSTAKDFIVRKQFFTSDSIMNPFLASVLSGVVVTVFMTPFDVMSTRMYNQGTDVKGKGLLYDNLFDCFIKIFRKEGFLGFYKGWGPVFIRLAPHTILSLVFWDKLRSSYFQRSTKS